MANETTMSSTVQRSEAIEAEILEAFQAASIMQNLVYWTNLEPNTKLKKLPKGPALSASVVAEGSAATPQAVTDTSVSLTIQKAVVVTKPTVEAQKFTVSAEKARHLKLAKRACLKKFEVDSLSLVSGFSQSVDAGTAATLAKLHEAAYTAGLSDADELELVIDAVLSKKQVWQIEGDIRSSGSAIYGNPGFSFSTVNVTRKMQGLKGDILGINVFESSNVQTSGGNFLGYVGFRGLALAALAPLGAGNSPEFETSVALELGFLESVSFIKTLMWYQVAEYNDACGVQFLSDT